MRFHVPLLIIAAAVVLLATAGTPDADELARRLDADSSAERDAAATDLLRLGERARPTLETLVREGSPEARRRSRALLGLLDGDDELESRARRLEARALVRATLRGPGRFADGGVARVDVDAAAHRLEELGDATAQELADRAARAVDDDGLSERIALGLARHPSRAGVRVLASALHRERIAGSAAVRAARALEDADATLLTDAARDDLSAVLSAPGDPRRRAAAALLLAFDTTHAESLATDPDPRVRIEAARSLGRSAGARALERLAGDQDATVREAALRALARVPGAPRPAAATRNADHRSAAVRSAAAALLGSDAVPASMPVLARLATDESPRVRAAAERSLALLERP